VSVDLKKKETYQFGLRRDQTIEILTTEDKIKETAGNQTSGKHGPK
jgi:hypothetical protein